MLALCGSLLLLSAHAAVAPSSVLLEVTHDGAYTVSVGGDQWYASPGAPVLCVAGEQTTLLPATATPTAPASGSDKFGAWTGTTASYAAPAASAAVIMELTFKHYGASGAGLAVATAAFPRGLDTRGCGKNTDLSTRFPSFNVSAARALALDALSWRGSVIDHTVASRGLGGLGATGLDCGPVVSTDAASAAGMTLVWSSLDNHKILPQQTAAGVWSQGVAGAIPVLPANYSYSFLFSAAPGGATAGVYAWGARLQGYYGMSYAQRLPSVTLSDIGYYTDDGAYYYVWGGGGKYGNDEQLSPWIPRRPWAAEEGLVLVKEALHASGVPVAYMQLDDWWYSGPAGHPFFFGNVKSVADWHASNSSGLFPHGLPAFAERLGLPLQLYAPFWADEFETPYRTFESTGFKGCKLPVPADSYNFFADFFDLGLAQTGGRFGVFEIDFLDANFAGAPELFASVGAADEWYNGINSAALERNISLQYCLSSATDQLLSLSSAAVVQARASGDYARPEGNTAPWGNVVTLGGASLLLGACAVAPSKDTLWTSSPQPPTSSDRTHAGYHTQPHVALDAILATLSLGPVGISDALNHTDVGLISQAFRSARDSTLLRPSRPLSTLDSVWSNISSLPPPTPAPPTPPTPAPPTPAPFSCAVGAAIGCYDEPKPGHFFAFDANTAAGLDTNDPQTSLETCAARCGRYAADPSVPPEAVIYMAAEAADQCRCGSAAPEQTGGTPDRAAGACGSACKGNATETCGGDWKASVYKLACSQRTAQTQAQAQAQTVVVAEDGKDRDYHAPSMHPADAGRAVMDGRVGDVRGTHASLGGAGNGPNSHYLLAWMTTEPTTLQRFDLYPAPAAATRLALRRHVVAPAGAAAQLAGCVDGKPAVASGCVEILPAGVMPTLPAVGVEANDITAFGYWSVNEPTANGAYFLGELTKFVHVSPQRFAHVRVAGGAPCGLTVGVKGSAAEVVTLVAVDPAGTTHVAHVTIPSAGSIDIMM